MKKILLICLFISAMCGVAWAQRPVGDTLTMPDADYYSSSIFHQCWPIGERGGWNSVPFDEYTLTIPIVYYMRNDHLRDGNYIGGMQMFTEHPLKVVGIAVCAYMQRPMDTTNRFFWDSYYGYGGNPLAHEFHPDYYFLNTRDTTMKNRITDSAILYRVTADGPRKLAAAPWRIEHPHRFIHLPPMIYGNIRCVILENDMMPWTLMSNWDQDPVLPLYEVMFDSAVVVEDSFVVASTALNNEMSAGVEAPPCCPNMSETMWLWEHNPTRFYLITSPIFQDTVADTKWIAWVKYRQMDWRRICMADSQRDSMVGTWYWHQYSYPFSPLLSWGLTR